VKGAPIHAGPGSNGFQQRLWGGSWRPSPPNCRKCAAAPRPPEDIDVGKSFSDGLQEFCNTVSAQEFQTLRACEILPLMSPDHTKRTERLRRRAGDFIPNARASPCEGCHPSATPSLRNASAHKIFTAFYQRFVYGDCRSAWTSRRRIILARAQGGADEFDSTEHPILSARHANVRPHVFRVQGDSIFGLSAF
jgi:hypothetical protein